jgi:hypothetical protein
MRSRGVTALAVLAAAGMLALPAGAARAAQVTGVQAAVPQATAPHLTGFHQIVVDDAEGYVFLSEGEDSYPIEGAADASTALVVTTLSGAYVTTLDAGDGVEGLALAAGGGTLYVALAAKDAVAALDVASIGGSSPSQTLYAMPSGSMPYDLVLQSGKLWVSYDGGSSSDFGDFDLSVSPPAFTDGPFATPWNSAPDLGGDPSDTGVVVGSQNNISLAQTVVYDTSADPATAASSTPYLGGPYTPASCQWGLQPAVLPGGTEMVDACGAPAKLEIYKVTDLQTPIGAYGTGGLAPVAVADTASGTLAVGSSPGGASGQGSVYVYQPDRTLVNVFRLGSGVQLAARGLAWSADGSTLYAVTMTGSGSTPSFGLRVLRSAAVPASTLTLSGPGTADITKALALSGKLTLSTGVALSRKAVTVTRTETGSTATRKFTLTTAPNGSFQLKDTPPALGKYTYTAVFAGASGVLGTSAAHVASVVKIPTALTVTASGTDVNYQATATVTAHLGPTYTGRTVSIYAQVLGSSGKKLLRSGRVNARGELTASYRAQHSTTFSVVFAGDARYAPRTASRAVYVRAQVTASLSGYYGINGSGYALYHAASRLKIASSVAPDKHGQCVQFAVQEYYQGAWQPLQYTSCVTLSKSSSATTTFNLTQADKGYPYRIRANYLRSASDRSNLDADSSWRYFRVEP